MGLGTVVLSGANTYTGTTAVGATGGVNAGLLQLSGSGKLSNAATTVFGGTLDLNGTSQTITTLTLGGGASGSAANVLIGSGNLTLGGTVTYTETNNPNGATISGAGLINLLGDRSFTVGDSLTAPVDLTVSAIIANGNATAYGIAKAGAGTMVLSGNNTYTGITTISGGVLSVSNIGNGGVAGNIGQATNGESNINLGGILQYTGTTASTDRLFRVATNGGTLDASGSGTINFSNNGSLGMSGSNTARTLTLTGTNTGNNTLAAVIGDNGSGATSLTKSGIGTWVLSGTNTYNGTTTVSAGKLTIDSAGTINSTSGVSIGAGEFNYNSSTALSKAVTFSTTGGTLSGSGTITTAVTVSAGNFLSPGNSIGTLTFGTGLTIAGTYTAQLGTPNASAPSGLSDRAVVTGGLTLTGSTLALVDNAGANSQGSAGAGAYRIATYTTTLTGTYSGGVTNPMSAALHEKVIYGAASGGGNVDLNLYRLGATTIGNATLTNVHVGGSFANSALSIQNTASNDGFSEGLNATQGATTGNATVSGTNVTNLAAGSTSSTILVGLGGNATTGTSGNKSGTVSIGLASNGSGTSGYGNTALSAQIISVSGVVYDYAAPSYSQTGGNGSLSGGGHSYTLNFGTGLALDTTYTANIDLTNGFVSGFQDLLGGTFNSIGIGFSTNAVAFNGLAVSASHSYTVSFITSSQGTFNGTLTLTGLSQPDGSGLTPESLGTYDIALVANAVPEPSTWALLAFSLTTVMVLRRRRNS